MKEIITQKAENIRGVIRYLQKFKNALIVIYIDENIIESELFLSHIQDISLLHKAGLKVVIVPGARKRIDEILSASNIVCQYKDDIRVTSEDAMPLIKMAAFEFLLSCENTEKISFPTPLSSIKNKSLSWGQLFIISDNDFISSTCGTSNLRHCSAASIALDL